MLLVQNDRASAATYNTLTEAAVAITNRYPGATFELEDGVRYWNTPLGRRCAVDELSDGTVTVVWFTSNARL